MKSKLTRFKYYKYSGPIVFVPVIFLLVIVFVVLPTQLEFFERWSCTTLTNYENDVNIPKDMIKHDDLTKVQHLKLHQLLDECNFSKP